MAECAKEVTVSVTDKLDAVGIPTAGSG